MIKFGPPSECDASERTAFVMLVEKYENIPNVEHLKYGVDHARLLLREFRDDKLVGVAAIKIPRESHTSQVFNDAGLGDVEAQRFTLELGYIATHCDYFRQGIAETLVRRGLEEIGARPI